MAQFSLRRLLASVTLFAVGLAIVVATAREEWPRIDAPAIVILLVMAGASFGAAVFMPFKSARIGAIVGALIGLLWALELVTFKAFD